MLLMPMIPHLAYECWGDKDKRFYWPEYDISLLEENDCTIIIQVDGRKRGIFKIPINTEDSIVLEKAKMVDNVSKYIKNKKIKKNIYVKNRLVNFITVK